MTDQVPSSSEPLVKRKPHLSVTQIDTHNKCPEAWRRRYEDKDIIPPGFALIRGRAVHQGAEFNFRQKTESHVDLPVSQIVDVAVAQVDAETAGGVSLTPDEIGRSVAVVKGETIDEVAKLARLHAIVQAPEYQPVAVEETIRVSLPQSSHDLLCVIDLVDDRGAVIDLKTSGKAVSQSDADASIQMTAYHFAKEAQTGTPPTELAFDVMISKGSTLKRQRITTERDQQDVNALGERFGAVVGSITSGVFAPAAVGCWWCSAKWCGYHSTCRFVGNGQKRQGD